MIPVILDYGKNDKFVHQTMLIIDFDGKIMFYEPYGKYIKYKMDYSACVCDLFSVFGKFFPDQSGGICDTYHNIYGLDTGIQSIIMGINNKKFTEFKEQYNTIIKKIQNTFPDMDYDKNAISTTDDKTVKVLSLMGKLNNYGDVDDGDVETFKEIYNETMGIYCSMNSKTCVTITLVEMNYLLKIPKKEQEERLRNFYNGFRVDAPNIILMEKLSDLLKIFGKNERAKLLNIIKKNIKTSQMCKLIL